MLTANRIQYFIQKRQPKYVSSNVWEIFRIYWLSV